jgi:ribose transport system permease protein
MSVDSTARIAKLNNKITSEIRLLFVSAIAIGLFSYLNSYFFSLASLKILLITVTFTGIILIGQALLMIAGEFDLSVGAVASLGAISTAIFIKDFGMVFPVAMIIGLLIGAFAGFLNGIITVRIGIPAFVTTLSMLFLCRGISYVLSKGDPVYPLPQGTDQLASTEILGFKSAIWIFLLLFLAVDLFTRYSVLGRKIYAIGGNKSAALLSGIRMGRIKIALFTFVGSLSALAGILLVSKMQRADPVIGLGWELSVIAAAAVGGIKLTGGAGSLTGAFVGLIFLQIILQGLIMVGMNSFLLDAIIGTVMIISVYLAFRKENKQV